MVSFVPEQGFFSLSFYFNFVFQFCGFESLMDFPKEIAKFTPKKTKKFPIVLPPQDENPPKFLKKVKVE